MSAERLTGEMLASVAEIERLCFAEPWEEQSLMLLLNEPNYGVAKIEQGKVCAYGGVVVAADEGEITNIATHPRCRRRGYAREILARMIEEARERGLCRLCLEVRESNEGAIALYESMDFRICGRRKALYRFPLEDGLVMIREV